MRQIKRNITDQQSSQIANEIKGAKRNPFTNKAQYDNNPFAGLKLTRADVNAVVEFMVST